MPLVLYQVDAFTSTLFSGNPAAVIPLQHWLETGVMHSIALENNLSETVFFVAEADGFHIRWFTPTHEVDLCGHATLAAAYVIFNEMAYGADSIHFSSRSGPLQVTRSDHAYCINFPSRPPEKTTLPGDVLAALGAKQAKATLLWAGKSNNYLLEFESERQIVDLQPDFTKLLLATDRNIIVTAKSDNCNFVSRFFAVHSGLGEDPVTGSAHCTLTPYWSQKLGKSKLYAKQRSARGGEIRCEQRGNRVMLTGECVLYMRAFIAL